MDALNKITDRLSRWAEAGNVAVNVTTGEAVLIYPASGGACHEYETAHALELPPWMRKSITNSPWCELASKAYEDFTGCGIVSRIRLRERT